MFSFLSPQPFLAEPQKNRSKWICSKGTRCSTINISEAQEAAALAREKGFTAADAPVSGGVVGATAGTLAFMVGAPDEVFEREHALDLGGVTVRLRAVGPTHTPGDTIAIVEGDGLAFYPDWPAPGYYDVLVAGVQELIAGTLTPEAVLENIAVPYEENKAALGQ